MARSPVARKTSPVSRFPAERLGDAELVEAVARGDSAALGVIWDRYSGLVRGVLRANLGFDAYTEDLLQEVFVALLKGARDLRAGGALRAYLVSVAVRLVLVELRRRRVRRWVTLSATGEVPHVPLAPGDLAGQVALEALERILDRMPRRRRVAFVLRSVQGFDISEVAEMLETSESTVKREVARARKAIFTRAARSEPALWDYLQTMEAGHA